MVFIKITNTRTNFDEKTSKDAVPRKRAFWGRKELNFRPFIGPTPKTAILEPVNFRRDKFSPENGFNIGHAHL